MPLLQYFGWVGSFLLAALLAANWCFSSPIARGSAADAPLDQRINIRIRSAQKWPERVVFDTSRSTPPLEEQAGPETDVGGNKTAAQPQRQAFDAFAEVVAIPVRPRVRPAYSAGQAAEQEASPTEQSTPTQPRSRSSSAARKGPTFPSPLHTPQGKS
jgi:hypothetical protein